MDSKIVIQVNTPNMQAQQPGFQQPMYGQPQQPGFQQPMYGQPQQPGFQQPMYGQPQQPMYQPQPQQPMYQPQQPGFQQPMYGQPQQPMYQPQPQQPMYAQPQQPMYAQPQQPIYVQQVPKKLKGYDRIASRDGIFIRQKKDIAEIITGCEQENTYYVYPLGKDGDKKGKSFYKCKEKSGCCARQCLSGECRPFQLKINLEDDSEELDNEPFLFLDRPCACTCYCCGRPELTVTNVEDGKSEYLGKIIDPFTCYNIVLDIMDKDNNIVYKIDGSCCQLGIHCKFPCDACQTIDFDIKLPSGDIVGSLQKRSQGCVAAMVSDADNFALNFPANCSKENKALLLAAVLFLDFRHFEENKNNNNNNHHHHGSMF